jgi:hypothetical protein
MVYLCYDGRIGLSDPICAHQHSLIVQRYHVARLGLRRSHSAERGPSVRVVIREQVRVDGQRLVTFACPMNRLISSGGIRAATRQGYSFEVVLLHDSIVP